MTVCLCMDYYPSHYPACANLKRTYKRLFCTNQFLKLGLNGNQLVHVPPVHVHLKAQALSQQVTFWNSCQLEIILKPLPNVCDLQMFGSSKLGAIFVPRLISWARLYEGQIALSNG